MFYMSKIGKKSINVPAGVEFSIGKNNKVVVKSVKGKLEYIPDPKINIEFKDNKISLSVKNDSKKLYALWGTSRALIANMVHGVEKGYEKKLELQGVGYKVFLKGKYLELSIGFSHKIVFRAPENIEFKVDKNIITISGVDKQLVGQAAASIRNFKKPEPYKGKGIRYVGEQVRRKVGKRVAGTVE